jgi:hypothetical protein
MHGLGIPAISPLTTAATQAVTSLAKRASTAATNFESDLQSGNVGGAQSFLATLQTKLGAQSSTAPGSAISSQITQVSNDLKIGDLSAAQNDFATLRVGLSTLKKATTQPIATNGSGSATGTSGATSNSPLAALQSYNALEQSAYNSALSLALPQAAPTLSVNS